MPLAVDTPAGTEVGLLTAHLELGSPTHDGDPDREHLLLSLRFGDATLVSRGWSGWFEDELLDLQRQLPPGRSLRACITCCSPTTARSAMASLAAWHASATQGRLPDGRLEVGPLPRLGAEQRVRSGDAPLPGVRSPAAGCWLPRLTKRPGLQ